MGKETQSCIRVFARIRPPRLKKVKASDRGVQVTVETDSSATPPQDRLQFRFPRDGLDGVVDNQKELYTYQFAKAFQESTTQEEVYDNVAKDVVDR